MRQLGTILKWILPVAVAIASFVISTRLGSAASTRVYRAVLVPGLLCIYGSTGLSWAASQGLRLAQPVDVPPGFFRFLGWVFLLASFVPVLINRGA